MGSPSPFPLPKGSTITTTTDLRQNNSKIRRLCFALVVLALAVCQIVVFRRKSGFTSIPWAPRRIEQRPVDDLSPPLAMWHRNTDSTYEKKATNIDAESTSSLNLILKSLQRSHGAWVEQEDTPCTRNCVRIHTFPRYNASFPCYPAEPNWKYSQRKRTHKGFLYVKTYKTASTTVMGVVIRIALKSAQRHNTTMQLQQNVTPCKCRFAHWPAYLLDYRRRIRNESFLFAILREPTQRAISMFFHFLVSRRELEPTDEVFQTYLSSLPGNGWKRQFTYYPRGWTFDHYLHFLSVDGYPLGSEHNSSRKRIRKANQILRDYDFIGITERLDESLVVLQMILGLQTTDILYSSDKQKGTVDALGFYIQPPVISEGMQEFFASDTWKDLSKGDYLLYLAANASLDRTIDSLGRDEFNHKLSLFRHAMERATRECSQEVEAMVAKSHVAKNESVCLFLDAGCGSPCFDQLEQTMALEAATLETTAATAAATGNGGILYSQPQIGVIPNDLEDKEED